MPKIEKCALCEKERILTRHHLIPKIVTQTINPNHKLADTVVKMCEDCHKAVHNHLIDHIFNERKFNPSNKVDYLKLYMLKEYLKKEHPSVWQDFKKHWQSYLKDELKLTEEED